jgi:hypothetical protein
MFKIYLDSKKEEIEQNISQIQTKINKSLSIDDIKEMDEEEKSESDA